MGQEISIVSRSMARVETQYWLTAGRVGGSRESRHGRNLFLVAGLLFFSGFWGDAMAEELVWGTNALKLPPAFNGTISLEDLLRNPNNSVSTGRFYQAGGENLPVTPTECRIAHNADELLVVFRCVEKDPAFPALHHGENWYSQLHSAAEQDAAFPDKVDLFVAPDLNKATYYQFAVTLDGQKFGAKRRAALPTRETDEQMDAITNIERVQIFSALVSRSPKGWTVLLRIPWKTIGGRPEARFGLIPVRTRWRQAEVTSPVAADFTDRPPSDLFIEACFPGASVLPPVSACLCQLPSGALRWQRPALLSYPDKATVGEIWKMEQSISQPTDTSILSARIQLTQRWVDLLTLEGCSFRPVAGSISESDLSPAVVRRSVNAALRAHDPEKACGLLDAYLRMLDAVSRKWFADGSPGDILASEWTPVSELKGIEEKERVLVLHCAAGNRPMDLHLSLPKSGGVRLWANAEGHFKTAELLPLDLRHTADGCNLAEKVVVTENPFVISFLDSAGNIVTQVDPRQIAFRFSPEGKVEAVDFRNRLETNEVIYGFGEKYDRFNQNGNVLTLWGVDDWVGLTAGLRNQSYKPVPLFHSSKGYSAFVNSSYRLRADLGKTQPDQFRLTQQGPVFDYFIWTGPPQGAIASYTALTGRPLLPPKWAFEPWMGRTGRGWSGFGQHDAVAEQERVITRFSELDIPHSALYAEGGGADSPVLNHFAAARGIHVLSWANSCITEKAQSSLLSEKSRGELPVLHTGSAADVEYVDFTHPQAAELCRRWWARRLNLGVAGSMVDFGDRTPEAAVFYNGQRGDEMHNVYSYDYQKTDYEIFQEKRGEDFILFGRAAAPGVQQWAAQFAGDHPANFSGLQAVLEGALNLSACGFSTWGSDLGGFLGWPEPSVYMRWTQFACFSPLMRCHGRTPREPWEFGEAAIVNYKRCAWLRENLLDYIYSAALEAHRTGIPIMRSLAVAYPRERWLATVDDQYVFGRDLLVAPVLDEGEARTMAFPAGKWTSLWDGKVVAGPANLKINAPLDMIPVFIKEGAAIPVQLCPKLQFGESMAPGRIHALVVTSPAEKEEISLPISQNQEARVTIQPCEGGFSVGWQNLPETHTLLIYGGAITAVDLDGKRLPKRTKGELEDVRPGWNASAKTNRVCVRLPVDRSWVEIKLKSEARHMNR